LFSKVTKSSNKVDPDSLDAFSRLRVSNPFTLFDSKQIFDNQPLFWDDQEVSGSGTTSLHTTDKANTVMAVSANTAGKRVRQTFQYFNYQPGKSQLVLMTGSIGSGFENSGNSASMGLFNDDNGIFAGISNGVVHFGIRSSTSGSPVDTLVNQSDWNLDTLDGSGKTGLKLDPTKTQILIIDFEWLGVGSVRCGWVIDGVINYCHVFQHANQENLVYTSSPNLPLRYEIENDGTGPDANIQQICATVISEGGEDDTGVARYVTTSNVVVHANTVGTIYAVKGIRLKSSCLGAVVKIIKTTLLALTNDNYEWCLILNPTKAVDLTWSDVDNSCVQEGAANTASPSTTTLTGGTVVDGGFGNQASANTEQVISSIRLGSSIDGTPDELILGITPLSANLDFHGSILYRESF
jgi:hypothetical protein